MADEPKRETFDVSGEGIYDHVIGDEHCTESWCGFGIGFPYRCECGGLVHADFGDEDIDGEYWIYEKCDKCGNRY